MSNFPDPSLNIAGTIRLVADAGRATAEIFVIDGHLQLISQALGVLDERFPPGLYLVQYKLGSSVTEKQVSLTPGSEEVRLPVPRLAPISSAPLGNTPAGLEYGDLAATCSRNPPHAIKGQGGQLFLFLRDTSGDSPKTEAPEESVAGQFSLSLWDSTGASVVADLGATGDRFPDGGPVACSVTLDPGTYFLRFDTGQIDSRTGTVEVLEQALVVCQGWQTQYFEASRDYGRVKKTRGPNLADSAILMVRLGEGFQPERSELCSVEAARQNLSDKRAVVPLKELESFSDPMLGILGAHLMLLSPQPDEERLQQIVDKLRSMVGDHPDVLALACRKDPSAAAPFNVPPMLRSSWNIILKASVQNPGLVPLDSYADRMSDQVWSGGAWLLWLTPDAKREEDPAQIPGNLEDMFAKLREAVTPLLASKDLLQLVKTGGLDYLQRSLLAYVVMVLGQKESGKSLMSLFLRFQLFFSFDRSLTPAKMLQWATEASATHLSSQNLVQALGVPLGTLTRACAGLQEKLNAIGAARLAQTKG